MKAIRIVIGVAVLLLAGVFGGTAISRAMESPIAKEKRERLEIYNVLVSDAKREIQNRLKAPATTVWGETRAEWLAGNRVRIFAEYDSENGFGALLHGGGVVEYQVILEPKRTYSVADVQVRFATPEELGRK